ESFELPAIEELLGERLACTHPEEGMLDLPAPVRKPRPRKPSGPQGRGGSRGGGNRGGGSRGGPPRRSGPRR
ncbi:MAG: ATP-dependent RNA helicase RhlB, partial [Kiritimatiellales bacterium]|nr:ATP-dependent RNA helicase RhlB [Kiritimatiellales bacterium]